MSEVAPQRIAAVTGANGYLGSRLNRALTADGWTVLPLRRDGSFSLDDGVRPGFFRDNQVRTLVHCAWDFSLTGWEEIVRRNVRGSVRLLEHARAEDVETVIFISTISAYAGCRSLYGRAKLAVETDARRLGAVVVRPGLVYGDRAGGMVGSLTSAVRRLPVVPLVGNGRQVLYPAHEDDVARLVCALADGGKADEPVIAASEQGWTLRDVVASLAAAQHRRVRVLPVPWRAVWLLLKAAETAGLRPGFRSDSVVSIVNQDPRPDFAATRATGVRFRVFTA
ncbi:NAD-dependent epimerase/dehydratase family protein [Planosporangium thailandense]|uniref:NAD-dependent epimerase/dehydratase family protein n=1 Tax=Planosporangium thailandense TaxID=765197 RepID=A0ABX0XUF1_9ACTN|nr:NAD-dependent epimerase/dehydratase family protein [Planosporangium thailandense]NJC69431.1 NAD-dependent epimerase/dehydratase family protein [Planosporangium thailandense]